MVDTRHDLPLPVADDHSIHELIYRPYALPAVAIAQELGLYEKLNVTPRTIKEVESLLSIGPRAAEALVAVSAALGLLKRGEDGRFGTTELGRTYFTPESPYFYPPHLMDFVSKPAGGDTLYTAMRRAILEGDRPTDTRAVSMDALSTEKMRTFIDLMHVHTLPVASALAEHACLRGISRLLDVAAGSGSHSCALALKNPSILVTAMDLPAVCPLTQERIDHYGVGDRVTTLAADMFRDEWPGGYDAALFSNIFHDWPPELCEELARRAYAALKPGGRILLCEIPLAETRDGPLFAACATLAMLVHERGKKYTPGEFEAMLAQAGFTDFSCEPLFGYFYLVSASKPV
ncbi:methyltransferase [Ruficoccus sp. ZRK36]|uniref:methyltransferase n=1 Tax=Ruficoccus sp. ZRK36 TaxID=2866311 RepID=UPI001C73CF30|nr:methyltransferase [Ruficoccus sp. ZRK36]QYY36163.1 methyltransferase domain-containing protein [Ruficoccus sp. ZRK36]